MLSLWLDAEAAITRGQAYTIGSMAYTRVNAAYIRSQVGYWRREVERLSRGRRGARVVRVIPRDL
ncbi:hypothetical protein KAR29_04810 [Aminithiophilus ramosus]|uniref:Uncharacterized protein n=2 Tax=Aminithiophilus ramosus TaxID=3029084 RepID=A0A9Q7ATK6_9BACT|nr:hypothetical protein KAR29_04810 [Aminithiophilus ramosus]